MACNVSPLAYIGTDHDPRGVFYFKFDLGKKAYFLGVDAKEGSQPFEKKALYQGKIVSRQLREVREGGGCSVFKYRQIETYAVEVGDDKKIAILNAADLQITPFGLCERFEPSCRAGIREFQVPNHLNSILRDRL